MRSNLGKERTPWYNRKTTRGLGLVFALGGARIAYLVANDSSGNVTKPPAISVLAHHNSPIPEQLLEAQRAVELQKQTQASAKRLAQFVMNKFNFSTSQHKDRRVSDDGSYVSYTVGFRAPTDVANGKHGEYVFQAMMDRNKQGQYLPANVTDISFDMIAEVPHGQGDEGSNHKTIYALELHKGWDADEIVREFPANSWSVSSIQGAMNVSYNTSMPIGGGEYSPISTGLINAYTTQALAVGAQATARQPVGVDTIPPGGK